MRVYLIRHGETVHNVAQAWAGTTDSALTNHGMLQIESLAQTFASKSIHFDSVFASDLSRARITAEGICRPQPPKKDGGLVTPILTSDLRERDFGSLEGVHWQSPSTNASASPGRLSSITSAEVIEKETTVSMRQRSLSFLHSHFLPLLFDDPSAKRKVAIVAHGIILRVLWNCLVELFDPISISLMPGIAAREGGPAALLSPSWSNTGFMELSIRMKQSPSSSPLQRHLTSHEVRVAPGAITDTEGPPSGSLAGDILLQGWSMKIIAVDNKEHLVGLRRTRGGIGSASYDNRQKRIDQFFK
ncbi:uncharacterized protein N7496_011532 [Penicillium cataractarum]|uniref:Phosphoglycerate mutase family protein n=1 Tax=Penicillium cataractarum TaxID=2100454 RepID=A0A9W9RHU7_9EURO|nr:uncharacterized protein N7496_011532 [Penicillium cataractarum]KAJ5359119.1 hypothetical protein N7496_011532 [Penicillium cataractarum]